MRARYAVIPIDPFIFSVNDIKKSRGKTKLKKQKSQGVNRNRWYVGAKGEAMPKWAKRWLLS
jgi:hypothetical protein